ncbi:MAG TPA: hypothetical protein VHQ65_05600 [Thermoanaerobaculia bacterium]|nr:hypothetical protein [Thermoanaerobaculia bacterium]
MAKADKTLMPSREEARALLASIPTDTPVGLRDREAVSAEEAGKIWL